MTETRFVTMPLPTDVTVTAPDGSGIRELLRLERGSLAHGILAPGCVSVAIRHRTVEEIWYVLGGSAEIWRALGDHETVETIRAGDSLTIPLGVLIQFRTIGPEPFTFIMCTMPPWTGPEEAIRVKGIWPSTEFDDDAL